MVVGVRVPGSGPETYGWVYRGTSLRGKRFMSVNFSVVSIAGSNVSGNFGTDRYVGRISWGGLSQHAWQVPSAAAVFPVKEKDRRGAVGWGWGWIWGRFDD